MQASAADQLRRQLNNARTQVDSLTERLTAVQHEAVSWQTAWEKRKYKHEVTLRDLQQLRTQRKQLQEQVQQLEQQLATCQAGIASLVTTCEPFLTRRQETRVQAALAQGSSPDQVLEAVEAALKHHLQLQQQAPSEGGAHDSSMALQEQQPAPASHVQDEAQPSVLAPGPPTGNAHSGACSSSSSSCTLAAVRLSQAPAGGTVNVSQPAAAAAAASPEAPTQQPDAAAAAMQSAMAQLEARAQALQQANQGLQQQLDAAAATHAGLRHTATRLSQQLMEAAAAREALQQQVAVLRASAQQVAWAGRAGAALLAVAGVAYLHWCEQQLSLARSNALVLQDRYQQLAQQLHGIDTTPAAALVGGASNA
jgi:chromosome segregation ATPase